MHGEHVTSRHSLNALDRAQARGVEETEDKNFQQRCAQATTTPPLGEVSSYFMEVGGTGGSSHLPRLSRAIAQYRAHMSQNLSLFHLREQLYLEDLITYPYRDRKLGQWEAGSQRPHGHRL